MKRRGRLACGLWKRNFFRRLMRDTRENKKKLLRYFHLRRLNLQRGMTDEELPRYRQIVFNVNIRSVRESDLKIAQLDEEVVAAIFNRYQHYDQCARTWEKRPEYVWGIIEAREKFEKFARSRVRKEEQ
ncbi:MAG: hypothetical protein KJ858_02855 [Nanoarchaeota archaeon]|nr:hypothetical protein [Nanoarchaeota archaeon]